MIFPKRYRHPYTGRVPSPVTTAESPTVEILTWTGQGGASDLGGGLQYRHVLNTGVTGTDPGWIKLAGSGLPLRVAAVGGCVFGLPMTVDGALTRQLIGDMDYRGLRVSIYQAPDINIGALPHGTLVTEVPLGCGMVPLGKGIEGGVYLYALAEYCSYANYANPLDDHWPIAQVQVSCVLETWGGDE